VADEQKKAGSPSLTPQRSDDDYYDDDYDRGDTREDDDAGLLTSEEELRRVSYSTAPTWRRHSDANYWRQNDEALRDAQDIADAAKFINRELVVVLNEQRDLVEAHQRLATKVCARLGRDLAPAPAGNDDRNNAREAVLLDFASRLLEHASALDQPSIAEGIQGLIAEMRRSGHHHQ